MTLETVRSQLEMYSKLNKTLEQIHNQGFYGLFQTSFISLRAQDKSFSTQEFKQCLKIVVGEMIETIWGDDDMIEVGQGIEGSRDKLNNQKKVLKKSVNSCVNLKGNCKIPGNAIFNKEKRGVINNIPVTPGPGDYQVENLRNRSKSPSAVFCREKRSFDIANTESPGPSAYSPSIHFQSKF